jgi:hypothetical protein
MKMIVALIVIVLLGIGAYFLLTQTSSTDVDVTPDPQPTESPTETNEPQVTPDVEPEAKTETIIGKSVNGRDITAYHYGTGDTEILFVGGIHGGYSWNTSMLSYEIMDYLKANSTIIPSNVRATVIPTLNPDGLYKVTGVAGRFAETEVSEDASIRVSGRFNANEVDLNRNFDCEWQTESTWQDKTVSGGSMAFSEPESRALKTYVESQNPTAVVAFYSAAGGVYASSCENDISPGTRAIMTAYSDASGYPAYDDFDFYDITGDFVNWSASKNIPGISIVLTTHEDTEWSKNRAGIVALLNHYAR